MRGATHRKCQSLVKSELAILILRWASWVVRTLQRFTRKDDSQERRRYLFLQYERALGSAINATPVFEALKSADPGCFITVACAKPNSEVFLPSPYVDRTFLTADPHISFLKTLLNIWGIGFRQKFDYVVTGAGNSSGRFSVLAALSGVKDRIGFTPFVGLYEKSAKYDPSKSVIENNLKILTLIGYEVGQYLEPRIFFTDQDLSIANEILTKHGLVPDQPIAAIVSQTSGGQPSQWYDDRFAQVADDLAARGFRIVFLGTHKQAAAINVIRDQMKSPSASFAGATTVGVLAAMLCHCTIVITLDTGTMHVGRAVQVPMVVIAAAWQPAHEWLPIGLNGIEVVRRNDIPCRHCRKMFCATRECMDEIGQKDIVGAADRILGSHPATALQQDARIVRCLVIEKAPGSPADASTNNA
jgi:ADP-heptose:LPS heptosyltransferase